MIHGGRPAEGSANLEVCTEFADGGKFDRIGHRIGHRIRHRIGHSIRHLIGGDLRGRIADRNDGAERRSLTQSQDQMRRNQAGARSGLGV